MSFLCLADYVRTIGVNHSSKGKSSRCPLPNEEEPWRWSICLLVGALGAVAVAVFAIASWQPTSPLMIPLHSSSDWLYWSVLKEHLSGSSS